MHFMHTHTHTHTHTYTHTYAHTHIHTHIHTHTHVHRFASGYDQQSSQPRAGQVDELSPVKHHLPAVTA